MMSGRTGYLSGSVFLRPPGRTVWYARLRLPDGTDSKRRIGPAWTGRGRPADGYFTEGMARVELERIMADFEGYVAGSDPRFCDVANEYLIACERKGLRATTIKRYRQIIDTSLRQLTDLRLSEISPRRMAILRDELGGQLSASSLNQTAVVLVGVFRYARRARGYSGIPPLSDFERVRTPPASEIDTYTPAEIEALAQAAASEQDAAIFRVSAFAGLRRGEIRGLRWRDVDFAKQSIYVRGAYTDLGGRGRTKSGKGRSVPMIRHVITTLDGLSQREHFTGPDDLVFCNTVGSEIDGSALYRRFQKAAERAGLRRLRLHDLRHAFGTIAVQAYPLSDVKAYMGHADIATTMRYVHFKPHMDAANRLGQIVDADLGLNDPSGEARLEALDAGFGASLGPMAQEGGS